jgi:hypothetical protein
VALFRALSCVMIISSRRVGPRLPAMGNGITAKPATERGATE